MKNAYCLCPVIVLCYLFFSLKGNTRDIKNSPVSSAQQNPQEKGLFENDSILEITLSGNVRELLNDKSETPKNHPLNLVYRKSDTSTISIPIEAKTRGHFRRLSGNCFYPPILLQFPKGDAKKSSIFQENSKLKLVMPCKGDEYIIYEWLVYRIYNLLTPKSFRARLVSVKLEDGKRKKESPFYGLLLEEEQQMAKRNGTIPVKLKTTPQQTENNSFLTMAVFEYLIGNTDWCVQYMQNVKLIAADSTSIPTVVPYDFDMAGIVNSPYAQPAEELKLSSCRERRYRGYCVHDMKQFDEVLGLFNKKKEDIYSIYKNCPLLDAKYIKSTLKFLDEFYATINDEKAVKKAFEYPCDVNGTGNILIKGLRDD